MPAYKSPIRSCASCSPTNGERKQPVEVFGTTSHAQHAPLDVIDDLDQLIGFTAG
jgi:hypothetical protein